MQSKNVALAVLASALLSATALAQTSPPAGSPPAPAASPSIQSPMNQTAMSGEWRASKLVGLDVYNANNEKIGDINEMLFDSSGKISTVVIGVGGFLGMGQHDVGLPFEQVKFVNEPVKSTATTGTSTTGAATTTTTTSANRDYPDHAMVNMTKDQLKALPAFKYASDTSSSTTRTTTSPAPATPPARSPAPPANPSR